LSPLDSSPPPSIIACSIAMGNMSCASTPLEQRRERQGAADPRNVSPQRQLNRCAPLAFPPLFSVGASMRPCIPSLIIESTQGAQVNAHSLEAGVCVSFAESALSPLVRVHCDREMAERLSALLQQVLQEFA